MEAEFGRGISSGIGGASQTHGYDFTQTPPQQQLNTCNKLLRVHAYAISHGSTDREATFGVDHVVILPDTVTRPKPRTERQALDRIARQM